MTASDLLPGITSRTIQTSRLRTHLLSSGAPEGAPVLFIHGNCSSARFFEEAMLAMPAGYRCYAADLRGYGDSEGAPIDATRGLRDFSDDLAALLRHAEVLRPGERAHLVGWSIGGGVALQMAIDHPDLVGKLVLEAPMSPYGFGGCKGLDGAPCTPDFAGSGGGTANPEFVKRLASKDASEESPFGPRQVMNQFYFKPPFRLDRAREDLLVAEVLKMVVGDDHYPGDMTMVAAWPSVAPGTRGVNNALSPKYCDFSAFAGIAARPEVLWVRGADDQVVSDSSLFDFGFLGKLGAVPGWPGDEAYPPQPMVGQMRAVLDAYRARGGRVTEEVLPNVGHSPHIEAHGAFIDLVSRFLGAR